MPRRTRPAQRYALGLALLALLPAGCSREVAVSAPAADPATAAICAQVIGALPSVLAGQTSRDVTPTAGSTAAWGDPPIVLRCGVPTPAGRTPTSLLATVDGVDWFAEELTEGARLTTDGRAVRVEVTVPDAYEPATVLGELAAVLIATDPGGRAP